MKKTITLAAVLAASLGFASAASAALPYNPLSTQHEADVRQAERTGDNAPVVNTARQPWDGSAARSYDRSERRDRREERVAPRYEAPRYYGYNEQPRYYGYNQPNFYAGGYLPYEYRQPAYYINDWQAYPGLYAPPYGYQWVQVGNDYLLVALASGLIANLLTH